MMKKLIISMIFLVSMIFVYAQTEKTAEETQSKSTGALLFNVGGKTIDFSLPDTNFSEASDSYSSMFNIFVPENNRLICGFLTKSDLKKLTDGKDPEMESYILVEVSKEAENIDCKPKDFKEVISSIGDVTTIISSSSDEFLKEVNNKLNSLDIQEIQFNDPKSLGVILSKEDAIASGMIFKVQQGESVETYICSMLLTRLKERLIFVYIYKIYSNETTVKEIISLTDNYATSLLEANPAERKESMTNFWDGLPKWGRNALIGGGIGLLYALISSMFKRKKPEEEDASKNTSETTIDSNNVSS